jgi:hypothetical protein
MASDWAIPLDTRPAEVVLDAEPVKSGIASLEDWRAHLGFR